MVRPLVDQNMDVLVVEPNISKHSEFRLVSLDEAIAEADVIAVLVKHEEFVSDLVKSRLQESETLDFCGALA